MAVEVTYLTWVERGLLRTVSYHGSERISLRATW